MRALLPLPGVESGSDEPHSRVLTLLWQVPRMTSTDSPAASLEAAPNEVRRFIIENQPVRGYWVDLEGAWQELRAHQNYPQPVRDLLGEAVSASVLLAATLKFEGTLTFQLEGKGKVRLLVAQCTHDFRVRA